MDKIKTLLKQIFNSMNCVCIISQQIKESEFDLFLYSNSNSFSNSSSNITTTEESVDEKTIKLRRFCPQLQVKFDNDELEVDLTNVIDGEEFFRQKREEHQNYLKLKEEKRMNKMKLLKINY